MTEEEIINLGYSAETLLNDSGFNELAKIVTSELSLGMLSADTAEERERLHMTYKGLEYFLNTALQFVAEKDQIVRRKEQEDTKD